LTERHILWSYYIRWVFQNVIPAKVIDSEAFNLFAQTRRAGIQNYKISNTGSPIRVGDDKKRNWDGNVKIFPWYLESNYQKAIELIRMEYALAYENVGLQLLQDGKQDQAFDRFARAGEVAPGYFDQNRLGDIVKSIQTATPASVPSDR